MSNNVFRLLLNLYPERFRAEYGDAMIQLFRDRTRVETGFLRKFQLWLDLLNDLARSVPREYRRSPRFPAEQGAYRMSEEGLAEMIKSHRRDFLAMFVSIALGFLIAWFGDAPRWPSCVIYGIAVLFVILSLRHIERLRDHWHRYELILDGERIQQRLHDGKTITLLRGEITKLSEIDGLGLAIHTGDPRNCILVPSVLSGFDALKAHLRTWMPIDDPSNIQEAPRNVVFSKWPVAVYPAALLVQSPFFAVLLAVILGAYFLNSVRRLIVPAIRHGGGLRKVPPVVWMITILPSALLLLKVIFVLR